MKKIFFISMITCMLCACSSDSEYSSAETGEVISTVQLSSSDFIMDDNDEAPMLRTSFNSGLKFTWSKGDKVGVWPVLSKDEEETASQVLFTLQSGASTSNATFKGTGWGLLHNRKYYAYFPYTPDATPTKVVHTYATELSQTTSVSTTHLGANDALYASAITPDDGTSASFQFHHLTSVMRINISLPTELKNQTLKSIVLTCNENVFPVKASFNPTDAEPTETIETYTNRLKLSLGNNGAGFKALITTIYAWFMTGAVNLEGKTLTVSVSDGVNNYEGTFTGSKQTAGHARQYNVAVEKKEHPANAIDMGLSILWADSNLGADAPEHFGDYYAWGETTPRYSALTIDETASTPLRKSITWNSGYTAGYTWTNYFDTNDKGNTFSKYTTAKQVLELNDDAAYVALGGRWRMPTADEVVELHNACTMSSDEVNGVKGVRFTSKKTGNSIFIPGSGYMNGTSYDCGNIGYRLWSSTLSSKSSAYGWYNPHIGPNTENMKSARERYRGQGIRPVYDPKQ